MIKLQELAEQAKFIADWHGADWSSALCQDKDGNQSHEIICESREESVISTGSNSNEASWLCDYLEMCSPENIIAIAKYVAELEQRLNATEQPVSDDNNRIAEALESLLWPNMAIGNKAVISAAINALRTSTAQPVSDGWVKCDERVPDNEDYYLTYSNSGIDVAYFDGRIFSDRHTNHWMPLPAAPGGQD